jgi:glucosylceramidase
MSRRTDTTAAYISNDQRLFEKTRVSIIESSSVEVSVYPKVGRQTIDGFGGAFNEQGWQALSVLDEDKRREVMRSLFDTKEGLGLTICRVPIGASDYALDRYTLNEEAGDVEMKHFSIERDRRHLIPYIKEAISIQPKLRLWGSAWTPPTWMKDNKSFDSGNFLDDPEIYRAYALYLLKFIRAYQEEGLPVEAVAVQNEPGTLTHYPSCDWTATQFLTFIRDYLGPLFRKEGLVDAIMLGTFNQPNLIGHALTVLTDTQARLYVSRLGLQWYALLFADKIRKLFPGIEIWQTETDCGNWHWMPGFTPDRPPNDMSYAAFTWRQMRDWFRAGTSVYTLWNMLLDSSGNNLDSLRPWPQNSPITVDPQTKEVHYTPMFGAVGSFARFITPGARLVATEGAYDDILSFANPDGGIVTVCYNPKCIPNQIRVRIGGIVYSMELPALSFGTLSVNAG